MALGSTARRSSKERILKGIAEFNEAPVPFRWKKFDLGCLIRNHFHGTHYKYKQQLLSRFWCEMSVASWALCDRPVRFTRPQVILTGPPVRCTLPCRM
jgi:hypothetical protein